ncbi:MAG: GNAT family N-acetyltransferase [Hyphomicrobiales bacterium]
MSASINLAKPEDLDKLDALVAAFHDENGIKLSLEKRRAGLGPLLEGIPHGCAYLIGPPRAPIACVIVTFGWSIEFGGLDGFIDELYVRPGVRGRGVAGEVLLTLPRTLASAGMKAIHLEVDTSNQTAQRLYARAGFKLRDQYALMTRAL